MSPNSVRLEEYLSPEFRPEKVANALLRATTTPQDTSVDVGPALKRLKYDRDEIDKTMTEVAKTNTDALLSHADAVEAADAEFASLDPALQSVTGVYNKLEAEFLQPLRRAQQLHGAAIHLHDMAVLSRSLSWYLQLALQAQNQDFKRDSVIVSGGAGAALLRSAQALQKIDELLTAMPQLEDLDAVSKFQSRVADLRSSVLDSAAKTLREFSGNESGHLKLAAMASRTLGVDLQGLGDTHLKTLVGTTVLQLSRNGGTLEGFQKAFDDAQARATSIDVVGAALSEVQDGMVPPSTARFWAQVAVQLDQKLHTLSLANQNAIKSMTAIGDSILATTQVVEPVQAVFKKYISK